MNSTEQPVLKYNVGQWVEVTVNRIESDALVHVGKIVEATRDYAIAECMTRDGMIRFTFSDDTEGFVSFRRMTNRDWQARKRAKGRRR